MRTGKSRTIVETSNRLHHRHNVTGVLVIAPNGVHRQWLEEFETWSAVHVHGMAWSSKNTRPTQINYFLNDRLPGLHVLTVNAEALQLKRVQKLIQKFLALHGHGDDVLIVFDESHLFRRPGARRTRLARGLAKRCGWRRILTGTAALNSPLHLFSQFELLQPGALGFSTYTEFKNRHATYRMERLANGRTFPRLVEYRDLDKLQFAVSLWSSIIPREEAELPPVIETRREVPLSKAQKEAYDQLLTGLWAIDEETELEKHFLKLQQVLGGFVLVEGEVHDIEKTCPRIEAMLEEVRGADCRVIIWARFKEDIRRIVEALKAEEYEVVQYHGDTPQGERDKAKQLLQHGDNDRIVFVGQPQSAGTGLTLSAASTVIWYSHVHDAIVREQASARATAKGDESVVMVDLVAPSTLDEHILQLLEGKKNLESEYFGIGFKELLASMRNAGTK